MITASATATEEFDRQVDNLIAKGYPRVAGMEDVEFLAHIEPLATCLAELGSSNGRTEAGHIPLVIVVKSHLARADATIGLVERRDKPGFSVLDAEDFERFRPIDGVTLPDGFAYLMVDIDTGGDTRNVTPDAALETITQRRRSPLTIEEGIALLTHYPEAVAKNAGFSLLGSRCGDRRVTAMWISDGRPKLGWCWAGNPHTWLGSASCAHRVGPDA
jgi:Family of unknown function (DUF5701)